MTYKFYGEPNMLAKSRHKKLFEGTIQLKPLFRFDDKGEYITSDERLIEKLKSRFDHMEIVENTANEVVEKIETPKTSRKRKEV